VVQSAWFNWLVNHEAVGAGIRGLCDELFACLEARLVDAGKSSVGEICKITAKNATLCQIYHRKSKLDIYLRWDPGKMAQIEQWAEDLGLSYRTRPQIKKGWAERWPIHVQVADRFQIEPLSEIILRTAEWVDPSSVRSVESLGATELDPLLIQSLPEGSVKRIPVITYERSSAARAACLEHYGLRCCVCGFDFEGRYGDVGRGFIHVHHIVPLASIGSSYLGDPVKDLRPVCPNCHEMLHRRQPPYSVDELKGFIR